MSLYLKIQENEATEFFAKYDLLGHLEKKIWKVIQWFVKKFPSAQPRQSVIAEKVGCSRKHVNKTLQKFILYGWISLISRGSRHAKIIGMPHSLMMMDVVDRKYFKKVEVTAEVTHSYSSKREPTSKEKAGCLQIANHLLGLKISYDHKLKLSLVSEHIYHEALYSAQLKHSKGEKIGDINGYVVGTAIRMAQRKNIKIDWNSYYRTKKMHPYA